MHYDYDSSILIVTSIVLLLEIINAITIVFFLDYTLVSVFIFLNICFMNCIWIKPLQFSHSLFEKFHLINKLHLKLFCKIIQDTLPSAACTRIPLGCAGDLIWFESEVHVVERDSMQTSTGSSRLSDSASWQEAHMWVEYWKYIDFRIKHPSAD